MSPRCFGESPEPESKQTTQDNQFKGSLFLIGGAADKTLADFVKIAGGDKANIAIITHASEDPDKSGDDIANLFNSLGVKDSTIILPGKAGLPKDANAVYMCGGDQNRLMRLMDHSLAKQLESFLSEGGLIGGSSAGAAAVATTMIAGGMADGVIRPNSLRLVQGLGLFKKVVVDTHVNTESRDARSMVAICILEDIVSMGLDEDTAIHVRADKVVVYGIGHARLFKPSTGHKGRMTVSKDGTRASVSNVAVTFLSAGDEFDTPR